MSEVIEMKPEVVVEKTPLELAKEKLNEEYNRIVPLLGHAITQKKFAEIEHEKKMDGFNRSILSFEADLEGVRSKLQNLSSQTPVEVKSGS